MNAGTALQATGLRKSFAGVLAVDSLDLEVPAGTVLGFLGPNGAGKTTVIRILSTLLVPESGSFTVAGVPSTRPVEIRRLLGVLPESAGYPPGQTGADWLTYHARLFGLARDDARSTAGRLLTEVGLADRGGSRIANYSRGMRQRLGIARALVNDPQVVFLDEPTLGLDPSGQLRMLELVTGIAKERGVTVVLSTHLLGEVEQVCDQVLILNRGRTVAEGTVAEVVRAAAAPRRGVIQVPADLRPRALAVLARLGIAAAASSGGARELALTVPPGTSPEQLSGRALGGLLDADVPVLGFTLEGGRLSDAFLTLTGADRG